MPRRPAEESPMGLLHDAFRSFDEAAETLQESYRALTARVEQLDLELAATNEALRANLKENEEIKAHLTAILESLSTGVIVAAAGIITRCNKAAERLLSVARGELVGERLEQVLARMRLDIDRYPVRAPAGVSLAVSRAVLLDASGSPAGDILLLQDVSRLRTLEERVQRRDRLAAMGEMVGRIAHEIRNPLGSVELFASMLRKDLAHDPTHRRYAEHISVAVRAMDRLLANLLAYARPDCSRAGWHPVARILEEVLMLASHEIARAPISTRVRIDPAVTAIWCDVGPFKQALLNVCTNAAQAMPEGGVLSIEVTGESVEEGLIRIAVADTGVGIDPAHRTRIFDPFFTTREEGTGLGLAIVHAIVDAHHGRVEIDSALGHGTTVTMLLPARPRAGGSPPWTERAKAD